MLALLFSLAGRHEGGLSEGLGAVCSCAQTAQCGAFRALSHPHQTHGRFPLNPAFAVGETPAVLMPRNLPVDLSKVCAQVWPPPPQRTYWSRRKYAARHAMQFHNQLSNGHTFGLFENKLLMKRVYTCLDIPFIPPYYAAFLPRAQAADAQTPGEERLVKKQQRELDLVYTGAEKRCENLVSNTAATRVACPLAGGRNSSSLTAPPSFSLRGLLAPYSRCASRKAIHSLHDAQLEISAVVKPISSTMSSGVTVWERHWKSLITQKTTDDLSQSGREARGNGSTQEGGSHLLGMSERKMLQVVEETLLNELTCCLGYMTENYMQTINHRGIMIEPRYDLLTDAPPSRASTPLRRRPADDVWELKFVILGGITQEMHALPVPLGTYWIHFYREDPIAGTEWLCDRRLSSNSSCAPLMQRLNNEANMVCAAVEHRATQHPLGKNTRGVHHLV